MNKLTQTLAIGLAILLLLQQQVYGRSVIALLFTATTISIYASIDPETGNNINEEEEEEE